MVGRYRVVGVDTLMFWGGGRPNRGCGTSTGDGDDVCLDFKIYRGINSYCTLIFHFLKAS